MQKVNQIADIKLIIPIICTVGPWCGFLFSQTGPNFLEGAVILACWVVTLAAFLFPYTRDGNDRIKIVIKRSLYAHVVLVGFFVVYLALYQWSRG